MPPSAFSHSPGYGAELFFCSKVLGCFSGWLVGWSLTEKPAHQSRRSLPSLAVVFISYALSGAYRTRLGDHSALRRALYFVVCAHCLETE